MAREKIRRPPQLTPEETRHYQQVVKELAEEGVPQERLRQEYREYAPDKPLGRAICESYPLEALTDILSERAEELGRAPVQREIFPLYRAYLKRRFGTWPAALRAAGLRPGLETQPVEEDWTKVLTETPEVGRALLHLAEQWMTCGVPPLRREVQQERLLRARFEDWSAVLSAAKSLDSWLEAHPTPLAPRKPEDLAALLRLAEALGRTPLREEAPETLRQGLRMGWGSWGSALEAAGLPPLDEESSRRAEWEHQQRARAGSCTLRLVREPTAEQTALLNDLEAVCRGLGRAPLREELPQELRTELVNAFGSLRNALFQLGRAPVPGQEAQKIRLKKRRRKSSDRNAPPA